MFLQDKVPSCPVYHYTSVDGFYGIITSRSIWATNILYLNDAAEFRYATQLAREEIETFTKKNHNQDEMDFLKELDTRLRLAVEYNKRSIYVCSFSEQGNLLSQWRGYCPRGTGFSIGFEATHLEEARRRQNFRWAKCIYERSEQIERIRQLLTNSLNIFREATSSTQHPGDMRPLSDTALEFDKEFVQMAPTLKAPGFFEEAEWRLISPVIDLDDTNVCFRTGKSMIIPYFKFRLADDGEEFSVKEVIIGPTPEPYLSQASIESLLVKNRVSGNYYPELTKPSIPLVKFSQIPYRTG